MHRSVLEDAEFITWANEHVVLLVGHGRGSHGTIDVAKPAKGEPKKQCALYPGLTCEQHDQILKDTKGGGDDDKKPAPKKKDKDKDRDTPPAFPALKFDGIPASFVVTPDGKATDHKGDREPGACRTGLEAAQKAFDEHPIPASKLAAVRAAWADAEKVAKNGKPRPTLEALAKLEAAAGGALPQLWVARVKAKVDALDAKAVTRLADVRKGKDPEAVTKALEALRSEFDVPLASATPAVLAKLDEALGRAPAAAAEGDAPKGDAPGEPPAGEPSAGGEPPAPPK